MKKRHRKRLIRKKITILALEIFLIIILIVYVRVRIKYEDVFYENTIINGVDCSLLTIEESKKLIQQNQDQYVLEINFKDNEIENISGTEIELTVENLEQELKNIKERQKRTLFLKGGTYNFDNFSYDIEKLRDLLLRKNQLQPEYMKEKTEIKYGFNSDSKLFEVKEQSVYYLDFKQVFEEVLKAIKEGKTSISMQNLYLIPKSDSVLDDLNSFISAKITYQLPDGEEYVLDASTLYTWLVQDDEGNYIKDEDIWNQNVEEFVTNQLSPLANTVEKSREFKPTGKNTTTFVEGGNYGYLVDKDAEIQKLKEELENQEIVNREPCYQKTEVSSENYGLGESYVEIDLTRQKVWVYVDGNLEIETDCVTGCINNGHETPTGIFTLTYKTKDKILRGEKLPSGEYEYESHVDYWMPFNGGIGLHDASWRDTFGGDIYINNGSHGCINLPIKEAEKLYSIINSDMPIIVYKSE